MSQEREFNASTIEAALQRASSELGISPDSLSYEVLDEGSSGFLGLGARDARILVSFDQPLQDEPLSSASEGYPDPTSNGEEESTSEEEAIFAGSEEEPTDVQDENTLSGDLLPGIREHVTDLLSAMGFRAKVSVTDTEDMICVELDSEDTALLIGQKGETIDSLQYLVNASVYRNRPFEKKIVLDASGYRERRVKAVQGMALRAAKRVSREGKAVELPPMSSSERRAVHNYLKDDPRVATSSSGSDENRRVTISPS